jgi:hypothetical protein
MITVSEETNIDFDTTAKAATEAFASKDVIFYADRIKWLYERGFGQGSMVVAAYDDHAKVGQIALLRQTICLNGERFAAVQLVDLWILKAYRSSKLLRRIYQEAERLCLARNIRFMVTMPNEVSRPLNEYFLKLKPALLLPIRAGISIRNPRPSSKPKFSGLLDTLAKKDAVELFYAFATDAAESGLRWDGDTLFERTNDPTRVYAAHATDDLLLISSSRKTRGVEYTMLCGFFARPETVVTSALVSELVRVACRFWKRHLFIYAGINRALPALPGIALSSRLRRPMLVQLRRMGTDEMNVQFDRFQLIDADFV